MSVHTNRGRRMRGEASQRTPIGLSQPRARARTRSSAAATAIGLVLVIPSIAWVVLDRSVWAWDQAWYGQVSIELWATLRLHSGTWPDLMVHAFGAKPPGIAWLGQFFVPFGYRLHSVAAVLLVSIVVCQAATLGLVFSIGRRLGASAVAGALAALAAAGSPLFVSMSHEYLAEPLQGLSVAWLLYVMVAAGTRRMALTMAQLTAAIALGLLAKASTPFYMIMPALAALAIAYRADRAPEPRFWWRSRLIVANVIFALALVIADIGWYSVNWAAARAHADTINSTLYGPAAGLGSKLSWWLPHFDQATFLPFVDWAVVTAIVVAVLLFVRRRIGPDLTTIGVIVASLSTIGIVILLLALHPVNEIRYTMPLVICVAIALTAIVSAPRWPPLVWVLAVVFCVEFGLVSAQSFGLKIAARPYPIVASPEKERFAKELDRVIDLTCRASTNGRINMVGSDFPFLNANTLSFLAAARFDLRDRRCYYTSLGYAESDSSVAWQRVLDFEPPYYIGIDYGHAANPLPYTQRSLISPNDPFNRVNQAVYRRVLQSGLFKIVRGSRQNGVVILRGHW